MTAGELRDLLVRRLVMKIGGDRRRWRTAIGDVRVYPLETHPHCNWSISPSGSIPDVAALERMMDVVRLEYPIVEHG